MRLTRLSTFFPLLLAAALAVPAALLQAQEKDASSEGRGGTAPRSSPDKYRAHATHGDVSIGAELLTRKQVSKEFAADLNACCLVVQIAVYPTGNEPWNLLRDDFTLAVEGMDVGVKPQSATVVSAKLTKDANGGGGVTTAANVGVGVEFGTYTDPVTGQPVHVRGVTTSAGVGVGVGGNAPPTAAERNREVIERELGEKGLPEAKISVPVSGYLYFSLPKQKKHARYRLEYAIKDETLALPLP
ncbi:MAG TPA: hypothetical protein VE077_06285 [Candidatus Methylomirabilis sp.]|nr:hypothetical protein [Candidatus Methylomirabilis sp.]